VAPQPYCSGTTYLSKWHHSLIKVAHYSGIMVLLQWNHSLFIVAPHSYYSSITALPQWHDSFLSQWQHNLTAVAPPCHSGTTWVHEPVWLQETGWACRWRTLARTRQQCCSLRMVCLSQQGQYKL